MYNQVFLRIDTQDWYFSTTVTSVPQYSAQSSKDLSLENESKARKTLSTASKCHWRKKQLCACVSCVQRHTHRTYASRCKFSFTLNKAHGILRTASEFGGSIFLYRAHLPDGKEMDWLPQIFSFFPLIWCWCNLYQKQSWNDNLDQQPAAAPVH